MALALSIAPGEWIAACVVAALAVVGACASLLLGVGLRWAAVTRSDPDGAAFAVMASVFVSSIVVPAGWPEAAPLVAVVAAAVVAPMAAIGRWKTDPALGGAEASR